jgi:hypothetical protein
MSLLGDVVACQRYDIGLETVGRLNRALNLFCAGKRPVVNI